MKSYKNTVLDKIYEFLSQNIGDYSYFRAETWYQKIKKHFEYMEWGEEEFKWIWEYLEEIEEESK